jgi:hypothetical protein
MLSDRLSSKFFMEFARRIPNVYQESKSRSLDDDDVDKALKPYYFGQTRYTLIQSLFLSVGRECGHDAKAEPCETNGFPIAVVIIDRFRFTVNHSDSADEGRVANASEIRKQHSAINDEYIQPRLPGLPGPRFDETKLLAAENIVVEIIYGCSAGASNFSTHGFLRIAIPYIKKVKDKDMVFYAANYSYADVVQMVKEREKAEMDKKRTINVAVPKLKKSQD